MLTRTGSVVVLCLALGSCSGTADDGPLGKPSSPGGVCVPADKNGVVTDGFLALRNGGSSSVRLRSVKLVKPKGVRLEGSYVMPIRENTLVGLQPGTVDGSRTALADAVLPARADRNLLTQLRLTDKAVAGTTGGLEVRYVVGHHTYRWVSRIDVRLAPPGGSCGS